MKIETIVNALVLALVYVRNEWWAGNKEKYDRRNRQQLAFRARILKMDAEHLELAKVVNRLRIHRMNEDRLLAYDLAKKILRGRK